MKVLLATPDLKKAGGVASFFETLQPYFCGEVDYITIGSRACNSGILKKWLRPVRDYWKFYRQLGSDQYDIVHLNPSLRPLPLLRESLFLLIAKVMRKKVLIYVHGWNWQWDGFIKKRCRALFNTFYSLADGFIVQSKSFKRSLISMGIERPIYIGMTAVDDKTFMEGDKEKNGGIEDNGFNILFLARVEKSKGIYHAIETYMLLKEKYPEITLTIAGDGSELESVQAYIEKNGVEGISILGWVSGQDRYKAFRGGDVYLFPTYWGEGMPCSLLEAMSHGLPVVARPVGGIVDLYEKIEFGYLVDTEGPKKYATVIEELMVNRSMRFAIGEKNRDWAKINVSASQVAKNLISIYSHMVNGG